MPIVVRHDPKASVIAEAAGAGGAEDRRRWAAAYAQRERMQKRSLDAAAESRKAAGERQDAQAAQAQEAMRIKAQQAAAKMQMQQQAQSAEAVEGMHKQQYEADVELLKQMSEVNSDDTNDFRSLLARKNLILGRQRAAGASVYLNERNSELEEIEAKLQDYRGRSAEYKAPTAQDDYDQSKGIAVDRETGERFQKTPRGWEPIESAAEKQKQAKIEREQKIDEAIIKGVEKRENSWYTRKQKEQETYHSAYNMWTDNMRAQQKAITDLEKEKPPHDPAEIAMDRTPAGMGEAAAAAKEAANEKWRVAHEARIKKAQARLDALEGREPQQPPMESMPNFRAELERQYGRQPAQPGEVMSQFDPTQQLPPEAIQPPPPPDPMAGLSPQARGRMIHISMPPIARDTAEAFAGKTITPEAVRILAQGVGGDRAKLRALLEFHGIKVPSKKKQEEGKPAAQAGKPSFLSRALGTALSIPPLPYGTVDAALAMPGQVRDAAVGTAASGLRIVGDTLGGSQYVR